MIHFDEDTVKRLRVLQRQHRDKRVYVKVTVLLMLHQGCTPQFIAESLGIDDSTVYRYGQGYEELGLEGYLKSFFVAYQGQLSAWEEEKLVKELRERLYVNSKQVAAYIETEFGIRYSVSAVVKFLVVESERINAQSCIELWKKQRRRHPGKTIVNICDNAPYYHSRVIKEWLARNPWCKIIYLPPYAPNLNLIERLWKYLRKEVISYQFFEHFAEFRKAVLDFFKNIKEHQQALETLLTLKFHIVRL